MIPVTVKVRSLGDNEVVRKEKDFQFNVFVHQKWTPYLMMVTLYNSLSGLNEFADEATYRLSGKVEMNGQPNISLSTMLAPAKCPMPAPLMLAGWWGDKFNRLFPNNVKMPRLKSVNITIDLLPERRVAVIENAWVASEVEPGGSAREGIPAAVSRRPDRARGDGESRGLAEGRASHRAQRCRHVEPHAELRRLHEPLHRSAADGCAVQ